MMKTLRWGVGIFLCFLVLSLTPGSVWSNGGGPSPAEKKKLRSRKAHKVKARLVIRAHRTFINAMCLHPSGEILASGSSDYTMRIWTLNGRLLTSTPLVARIDQLAFSPNGAHLVAGLRNGLIISWDVSSAGGTWKFRKARQWRGAKKEIHALAFHPSQPLIATGDESGNIVFWDFDQRKKVALLREGGDPVRALAFSPNGRMLASTGGDYGFDKRKVDSSIRIWNVDSRKVVRRLHLDHRHQHTVVFDPRGRYLAAGGFRGRIGIWSTQTWRRIRIYRHRYTVQCIAFHPHKTWQIASCTYPEAHVWNLHTGQTMVRLTGHTNDVSAIAYTPDGQTIVTGSEDGRIMIWNAP